MTLPRHRLCKALNVLSANVLLVDHAKCSDFRQLTIRSICKIESQLRVR